MSLRRNSNLTTVTLNDVTKVIGGLPSIGSLVTSANLEKGAVVVTDLGLRRLDSVAWTALANGKQFFIVQGKGAGKALLKSPVLTKGRISITTSKHKVAQNQISVLGFNGTTGALPVANDTSFFLKVRRNDNDAANRSQAESLYAQFKTDTSGTQEELAQGLLKNAIKNFSLQPGGYADVDLLVNSAGVANTGAGTITVAKGDRIVTFGTNAMAVAAVGDYIRLDESVGAAPALTDAVYKVIAATATTLKLDRPYTGTSMTSAAVGNSVIVKNVLAIAADFGIRVSGIMGAFDVNAFRDYFARRFTISFSDSSTLITHVQGAHNGNGTWQQVALDEYMTYGFEGQREVLGVPPMFRDQEVKVDGKYSAINIAWTEEIPGLVTVAGGYGSHLIYINLPANGVLPTGPANTGEELATVLGITPSTLNQ